MREYTNLAGGRVSYIRGRSYFRRSAAILTAITVSCAAVLNIASVALAAQYDYDLGVYSNTISFSKPTLVAGDAIRVYAGIKNEGNLDVTGYASFFQSNQLIGQSQVISVRAGGQTEEVWVDFTVPQNDFNIRVQVQGTSPADQNPTNDTAVSALFSVVKDGDGDGKADNADNCPTVANADQLDTDGDGQGNACDTDDDNDGVPDANEANLGTSPTNPDSDGDGVNDGQDAFPADPNRTQTPPPAPTPSPAPPPAPAPAAPPTPEAEEEEPTVGAGLSRPEEAATSTPEIVEVGSATSTLSLPPVAVISSKRLGWDRFRFVAKDANGGRGFSVHWDFGDGSSADGVEAEHRFEKPGTYAVMLTVTGSDGTRATDEKRVSVGFFDLRNWRLLALMGLIGTVAGGMVAIAEGARRRAMKA